MKTIYDRPADWREIARLFGRLFATAFTVGVGTYWLLHFVFRQRYVFGALLRMFLYHEQHPVQYIVAVALFYSLFVTVWGIRYRSPGWRRHLSLLAVFAITLLFSSAAGGLLWTFHDMQAGYFPAWDRRIAMFADGIASGVTLGWLVVLLSFPFNFLTTLIAYIAALYFTRRVRNA